MYEKRNLRFLLLISIFFIMMVTISAAGDIIYVKEDGTGSGTSWADAYGDLQNALETAGSDDEIWVVEGTYYPTYDYGLGIGDRGKHFRMKNGVGIYGGFAGTETALAQRDAENNVTILSGDIGVPDEISDNCYHVFYHPDGTNLDRSAVLDGFTITGGNADFYEVHDYGGGMCNYSSSPKVTGCTFTGNSADWAGGGMFNYYYSSPKVTNCSFTDNSADFAGGGMVNYYHSSPTVTNCTFSGNLAYEGGGMYNSGSSSTVTGCTFTGNSASEQGGGMYNSVSSNMTVTGCTFTGNSASRGGGMGNSSHSNPTVTGCTFTGNSANTGGGMYNRYSSPAVTGCTFSDNPADYGGGMGNYESSPAVISCSFTDNSADDRGGGMYNYHSSPAVTECTFSGNSADLRGGGMCNSSHSDPTVTGCTFTGNSALNGGGMYKSHSNPTVTNCSFTGNSADRYGGGMYNEYSSAAVTGCTFTGNLADDSGGGMFNYDHSSPAVTNCTFTGNSASEDGGGMRNYHYSRPTVTNCILWGNTASSVGNEIYNDRTIPVISYCDISGCGGSGTGWHASLGTDGGGNIDADPLFVFVDDYHLMAGSVCIDTGTNDPAGGLPGEDMDGQVRPLDGDGDSVAIADMGAYEFNGTAACIAVWPREVEFLMVGGHSYPSSQTVLICNRGGETLYWEISEDCEWLEVWPLSGVLTDEIGSIVLTVDASGLDIDEYSCVLTVFDDGAMNSPQTIRVTLRPSIQIAIDNADDGDTVVIPEGVYKENINFGGKNIVLKSSNPDDWSVVAGTVIDGSRGTGAVVTFTGTETGSCELAGFTITGGSNTWHGGGIEGHGAYAGISKCVITDNTTEKWGGGVWAINGYISSCKIIGNSAVGGGGGLAGCSGTIENCVVSDNTGTTCGGLNNCDGDIVNCTIANNSGGGINNCDGTIINCIIWGNSEPEISSSVEPAYSCFVGGSGNGNIDADPLFVNEAGGDYHLLLGSLCIDAGDNTAVTADTDMDGNERISNNVVDMGAYEFPNVAPVADAGVDKIVYAWIDGIAEVELDGSGSYDTDGDELSYLWTWEIGGQIYDTNTINPVIELPVGEHEITLVVNDGLEDSEPNDVVVTVVGPVEVDVRVMPRVLSRRNRGRYVLAVMQLPDGIGRDDIDENYGFVLEPGWIDATFWRVRRRRRESIVFAMFDRARLIDATEGTSTGAGGARRVEVSVAGKLISGGYIYGVDIIRIIRPGGRR